MQHTIVALMEDHPGVLNRVVSLFRRRGFNIESLTVGHTDIQGISRMTLVVDGTDDVVEQISKQLYKIIEVMKVTDLTQEKAVVRELALIKVTANAANRSEISQIADIYRARIVDVAFDSVMIEVTGPDEKIESLLNLLRPYGIKEIVRTGRVAMMRGSQKTTKIPDEDSEKSSPRSSRVLAR